MQNVHECQETRKLYYETQKGNGDGNLGNKEETEESK
jgi:hypothetical protein